MLVDKYCTNIMLVTPGFFLKWHTVDFVELVVLLLIVKVPIPDSILSKLYSIPVKRSV